MRLVVDIHSHIYPAWFVDLFRDRRQVPRVVADGDHDRFLLFETEDGTGSGPLLTEEYTSVGAKLAFMDRHGIDRSVVSLGNPWLETLGAEAVDAARDANARLGELHHQTGGRIFGMGVVPPSEPSTVATIVEEIADHPGLRGVIASTTIGGRLFDDPELDPVWASLARRRLPLMVHPMIVHLPRELAGYRIALSAGIGFPFQTTVALARLLLGGALERHPDLRVVAAHGGGALPFLIGRLEATHIGEGSLRATARRLLADAALYEPEAVEMAAALVGADHLMFGTDHPFPNADVVRIRRAIEGALSGAEAESALGGAAATWYALDRERP